MGTLPAAAVPEGAVIRFIDNAPEGFEDREVEILGVANGDPVAGQIIWYTRNSVGMHVGASTDVEVVSLPSG